MSDQHLKSPQDIFIKWHSIPVGRLIPTHSKVDLLTYRVDSRRQNSTAQFTRSTMLVPPTSAFKHYQLLGSREIGEYGPRHIQPRISSIGSVCGCREEACGHKKFTHSFTMGSRGCTVLPALDKQEISLWQKGRSRDNSTDQGQVERNSRR